MTKPDAATPVPITATILYDLVSCSHRVMKDLFADPGARDAPNPFVELLWERGTQYEHEVIESLGLPFVDLSAYSGDEKERLTLDAITRGESLIYSGRIRTNGLLGDPDLLRNEGAGYVAGDIKSGAGEEGPEDSSKPKKHYAVQLALYTDILERKGLSAGRRGFIWDVNGDEIIYDFSQPYGKRHPRTLWQDYEEYLAEAKRIVGRETETLPAYSAACKLCHWYTACISDLKAADDLTLVPELGRSKRDAMRTRIATIHDLADTDPTLFVKGRKTAFPGIGIATLEKLHARAKLIAAGQDGKPYLQKPVSFPDVDKELFFDIEVDPIRGVCYLHGFIERQRGDNTSERFVAFFAEAPTKDAERTTFAEAWRYLQDSQPCAIYYYSKYERTIYRKLREQYADICTEAELDAIFDPTRSIDLYNDVVRKAAVFPTRDFSIKSLATYLGFAWRDTNPSGAASIEWFDRWVTTADPDVRQRILDYNEDDCRAMRILRDAVAELPVVLGKS